MNFIDQGTVKQGAIWPTDQEQEAMRSTPHRFLNEALKLPASACSPRDAAIMMVVTKRCWKCGLREDAVIFNESPYFRDEALHT